MSELLFTATLLSDGQLLVDVALDGDDIVYRTAAVSLALWDRLVALSVEQSLTGVPIIVRTKVEE